MKSDNILQKRVELIRSVGAKEGVFLIFPEAALPFMVDEDKLLPPGAAESIAEGHIVLTGADRYEGKGDRR